MTRNARAALLYERLADEFQRMYASKELEHFETRLRRSGCILLVG